jgi:hypothetical protein
MATAAAAALANPSTGLTKIFAPESTAAKSIFDLSLFVLVITGIIFVVVFTLLVYSIVKFRAMPPLIGWAGASGKLSFEAWVLYAAFPMAVPSLHGHCLDVPGRLRPCRLFDFAS